MILALALSSGGPWYAAYIIGQFVNYGWPRSVTGNIGEHMYH
jgi:hypothetical protein